MRYVEWIFLHAYCILKIQLWSLWSKMIFSHCTNLGTLPSVKQHFCCFWEKTCWDIDGSKVMWLMQYAIFLQVGSVTAICFTCFLIRCFVVCSKLYCLLLIRFTRGFRLLVLMKLIHILHIPYMPYNVMIWTYCICLSIWPRRWNKISA